MKRKTSKLSVILGRCQIDKGYDNMKVMSPPYTPIKTTEKTKYLDMLLTDLLPSYFNFNVQKHIIGETVFHVNLNAHCSNI